MKIVLAITGASGAVYAQRVLAFLRKTNHQVEIVASRNGIQIYQQETGAALKEWDYKIYSHDDFTAPFASGSAQYDLLAIIPCSTGTLSRIATGISNDLVTRTADVFLKERRKIILVPRETPFSSIHLENMLKLSNLGVVILPANPSFYSKPKNLTEAVDTVTARILDHMGIQHDLKIRYGQDC